MVAAQEPTRRFAWYRDCQDKEHLVEIVADLWSELGHRIYVIHVDPRTYGVLVATDAEGVEWWDGNMLAVHASRLSDAGEP